MVKNKNKKIRVCYFGVYRLNLCRNTNYISGLRQNGAMVIECFDHSQRLVKYCKLFIKHWKIRNDYDVMIAGYPGHLMVLFAKIISKKPVIFNAVASLYEANIISKKKHPKHSFMAWRTWLIDWLVFKFANLVLVETNKQKDYLTKKFKIKSKKFIRLFTGADDSMFYPDVNVKKNDKFTVLFRGRFLPEAGVRHIVDAAKILEKKEVNFLIIGGAGLEKEITEQVKNLNLRNLEIISKRRLGTNELRKKMLTSHVSIGQVENHERLERTIPYKAFESLALKLPYINGNALGIKELLEDRKNCLLVNLADPKDLAKKIMELKNNPRLRKKLAENGYKLYKEKLNPKVLGRELLNIIKSIAI